jgi:hypothetical protein
MTDYFAQVHGKFASNDVWSFGWRVTSNQTPSAFLTTWSNAWVAAWTDGTHGLDALYNTTTSIQSFSVATLNASMHQTAKVELVSAQPGTSSDTALPDLNAICVSLRSTNIQKHGRGRTFLPAPVEGIVDTGLYTSTAMTRVKAAVTAVRSAITADGSTQFVTNLKALKDGTPPYQKTVITSILVARKPSTQERRDDPLPANYV